MIRRKRSTNNSVSSFSSKLIQISESVESVIVLREPQVRWFYRDADEKRWTAFNGYDSLNLETKYNEECADFAPSHLTNSWPSGLDNLSENFITSKSPTISATKKIGGPSVKVSVLCGLYDVDLRTFRCHPVYWKAGKRPIHVLRGVWFKDLGGGTYEPLEDDAMVRLLEMEYSKCVVGGTFGIADGSRQIPTCLSAETSPSSNVQQHSMPIQTASSAPSLFDVGESMVDRNLEDDKRCISPIRSASTETKRKLALHTVKFSDCHVDFYGPDNMYLYQDSTSLYIRQKLGMQKVGTRLKRGYKEVARLDDKPPEVTHLCFVVHGIGQKMGSHSISRCVAELRESCAKLQSKYFVTAEYKQKRIEFLPVEWRSSLQLDGDLVESITPAHVRGLRTTLNSSAMDIMYYTSPLYRTEIISSLLSELNRLYTMFCTRNPFFKSRGGKVSVIAHSLGCVLMYDLITGWNQPEHNHFGDNSQLWRRHSTNSDATEQDDDSPQTHVAEDTSASTDTTSQSTVRSPPDDLGESDSLKLKGKAAENSQLLQSIAKLGLQLEAAKTEVNRLERELALLLQTRNGIGPLTSVPNDRCSIANQPPQSELNMPSYFTPGSLLFKRNLQNLFCLGSPLPVYLVLRGIRPGVDTTQDNILPRKLCPRIFNIYHPADPVAYRLEPLVLKHYTAIQPVVIHRADLANKPDYDELPLVTVSGKEIRRRRSTFQESVIADDPYHVANHCDDVAKQPVDSVISCSDVSRSSITSLVFGFFSRSAAPAEPSTNDPVEPPAAVEAASGEGPCVDNEVKMSCECEIAGKALVDQPNDPHDMDGSNSSLLSTASPDEPVPYDDEFPVNEQLDFSLQLEHRLDYQLRASRYENLYLSILSAHTGYWSNVDVGMLILSQLLTDQS